MVFPVVMYGCDGWTVNKTECQRIDAFEPWCWRRLLKFPWTARRLNQSILREINPEYWLQGLMLKVKFQCLDHQTWIDNSLEKSPMLGKIEGRRWRGVRGWDAWTSSPMQWIWTWANSRRWWGIGKPGVLPSMGSERVGHNWELNNNNKVATHRSFHPMTPCPVHHVLSDSSHHPYFCWAPCKGPHGMMSFIFHRNAMKLTSPCIPTLLIRKLRPGEVKELRNGGGKVRA